jgi:hypothetical protein
MSGDHKDNAEPPPKFCAERIDGSCTPHGNNYQKHYSPNWKKFPQKYRIFQKDAASGAKKLVGSGIRPHGP